MLLHRVQSQASHQALTDLDNITSGFHSGELIIIAGRPGMGKTALALSMGRNAAVMDKVGVGMFSLEMANHQLGNETSLCRRESR